MSDELSRNTDNRDAQLESTKLLLEQITTVAHQLRSPLASTKWALKYLLDEDEGKITAAQRALITKGFQLNERAINLVNDMLAVARLDSGKFTYRFVPVQFENLVQETIQNLLPIAIGKNVHLEFLVPKDPLPQWNIDPDKINDVLQNLIDNAIKYAPEGGRVVVGAHVEGADLHLTVEDNGAGIPEADKEKIFSKFFRGTNAIAEGTEGSGLGLFISREIVLRHGGKIWFENMPARGTIFHVSLPPTSGT